MYNPATQVQVPTDVDLNSYYFKKKIVGASPTIFISKNVVYLLSRILKMYDLPQHYHLSFFVIP
jgi:hypothetical protein